MACLVAALERAAWSFGDAASAAQALRQWVVSGSNGETIARADGLPAEGVTGDPAPGGFARLVAREVRR